MPIQPFKRDQIKENGEKSNYPDHTHSSVTLDKVSDRQKTPKPQNSIRTIQNTPISRLKRDQIKENSEKSNYSDPRKKAPPKMTQTQVTRRQDIIGEPNNNRENTIPETLATLQNDTTMHEDTDGSNICPVCSKSVGAEGLVCKICNECLHAACEEVVAERNLVEYVCRTCLTVRETDHLHASPGGVPPGQPNGNDGTPEAEPSPCITPYTSRLPIATFRQNQAKPLSIDPYQPGQAPALLLPSPVPTVPPQHKDTTHMPELKK